MKVIKKGKELKDTIRVTCEDCEAILEIDASDITERRPGKPGDPTLYIYTCPCCQNTNYLESKDLNVKIIQNLHR